MSHDGIEGSAGGATREQHVVHDEHVAPTGIGTARGRGVRLWRGGVGVVAVAGEIEGVDGDGVAFHVFEGVGEEACEGEASRFEPENEESAGAAVVLADFEGKARDDAADAGGRDKRRASHIYKEGGAAHSPRRTVTAVPTSETRSPRTRTSSEPPRGEACTHRSTSRPSSRAQ